MQIPKDAPLEPAEGAEAPKEKNILESSDETAKDGTGKTEDDPAPRNKSITLKLSDRMKNTDKNTNIPAAPDWVLTWEEFFMGLAELQRVFCNVHDSNANAKVRIPILIIIIIDPYELL